MKNALANAAVVLVSLVLALLLCEVGARFALNTADYLSVTVVRDDALGITIAPGSRGFDAWGFRNPTVPETSEIVAVGDSHTFGNTATMAEAWPSVVAQETGRQVYNLGLGGYGPNQYSYLFTSRALKLHPKLVLCGLYMGDDFENAFSITYGLEHWAFLRQGNWGEVDANTWDTPTEVGATKRFRNWLSAHSMIYRLTIHGALAGLKEQYQFWRASRNDDPVVTSLVLRDENIQEAFRPAGLVSRLDQSSPRVQEGMRLTFKLLGEMNTECRQNGCRFVVVVIPTKESVFADAFARSSVTHLRADVDSVIANEKIARGKLLAFLDGAGIPYVDTLPSLRQHLRENLYARTTEDMHPGKNGYRVIGEAVASSLK